MVRNVVNVGVSTGLPEDLQCKSLIENITQEDNVCEAVRKRSQKKISLDWLTNDVEPDKASISRVHETDEPRDKANDSGKLPLGSILERHCVACYRHKTFNEGKGRINSKEKEVCERESVNTE